MLAHGSSGQSKLERQALISHKYLSGFVALAPSLNLHPKGCYFIYMDKKEPNSTRNIKSIKTTYALLMFIFIALAVSMLFLTTPDRAGPVGITTFFISLGLGLFFSLMWLRTMVLKHPTSNSTFAAAITALIIVGALALNTISIGVGEIVLMGLFTVLIITYWLKIR